jgi:indoleamine 2,3-dioxygenase
MQLTLDQRRTLLAPYQIDPERGFLPADDPLAEIPGELGSWCGIAQQLPKLLIAGKVRQAVDNVDKSTVVAIDKFINQSAAAEHSKHIASAHADTNYSPALERAMLALSYIAHAYIWGQPLPPKSLPAQLAVPWCKIASILGRPPVLSYASYALHNWKRLDKSIPIELGNIALVQNFLGGADEEWFVLVHVDIEYKAAGAIANILPALEAVKNKDAVHLEECLRAIDESFASMYATLERMPEHCDPYIYYHRVRPYIHGWKDHPLFPDGLIYEGVETYGGKPQYLRGETGAQSSIIPALDAALGIVHDNDRMRHYLDEMRDYMPPGHRAFIKAIEQGPSVREFVLSFAPGADASSDLSNLSKSSKAPAPSAKQLHNVYNSCIHWLEKFRTKHLEYARDYIFAQAQRTPTNPSAVGTGGTPFMPYLEKHRDETAQHLLK